MMAITGEYHQGARVYSDDIHPFKKYFEDLKIGETLVTHRRTVTEADIVNFGCVSGDHFYAHFDEIAHAIAILGVFGEATDMHRSHTCKLAKQVVAADLVSAVGRKWDPMGQE